MSEDDQVFYSIISTTLSEHDLKEIMELHILKSINIDNDGKNENINKIKDCLKERYKASDVKVVVIPDNQKNNKKLRIDFEYSLVNYCSTLSNIQNLLNKLSSLDKGRKHKVSVCIRVKLNDRIKEELEKKLHRIKKLQWFIKTKYNTLDCYINRIVLLPEIPSISILRTLYKADSKNLDIDANPITIGNVELAKTDSDIYKFNNFIIYKISQDTSTQKFLEKNYKIDSMERILLYTLFGILSDNRVLLPWPFSSFQLADDSDTIYTLFIGKFKVNKIVNNDKQQEEENDEILQVNNPKTFSRINLTLEGMPLDHNLVGKSFRIVCKALSSKQIKEEVEKIGLFLGKAFNKLETQKLYLLKVFDDTLISEIREIRKKILDDPRLFEALRNIFHENNTIMIKDFIVEQVYQNNDLFKLAGINDIIKFHTKILIFYKDIYKKLFRDSYEPSSIINV
ncbi:hypothetical protein [Stygiolobus caldivivus]|uniref:Uncharacterized protein n=1 Tax=Stygiolobus caldivivus TaxID=2824673 RepID=A0A8D5U9R3_9CREN|nr:hypothetical protein [Stygiolobus caldivivus]BCU71527.1 hypothetical protein KN1_28240 [Stygiolobus caldivivus]